MRKLTTTLMAGAAVAVATAANAVTLPTIGTYIANSVTTTAGCGAPIGTQTASVFNLATLGKTGDYTNTPLSEELGPGPAIGYSSYATGVPKAGGTWISTSNLLIRTPAGTSTEYAAAPFTDNITFLDKNSFLISGSSIGVSGVCDTDVSYIRVGK